MGDVTLVDSTFFWVENIDVTSPVLRVTASATGTYTGADFSNVMNKGGKFFISFTTIGATSTARITIQSKDPVSGLYISVASLSLDAITTGNINIVNALHMYPGLGTSGGTNETNISETFSRTMRVIASFTATASVGGAANSMTVGLCKML